jgi:hypothetical protein
LLAVACAPALAQDDAAEQSPSRCISLPDLERTDVIDNRTLIFHMRDGALYLNHLERACPGLKRDRLFMYSPTSTQLCAVDGVTVIEKRPFGFTRGFTCALGEFNPLTQPEYESLVTPRRDPGVKTAEVPTKKAPRGQRSREEKPADSRRAPATGGRTAPTLR